MALVQYAYGSSDSGSENEDSGTTEDTKPVDLRLEEVHKKRCLKSIKEDKKAPQVSKKIQIAIPDIIDDTIEDDPSETMIPKSASRLNANETSGLLLKLPPPKNAQVKKTTTSFVPHTVSRKPVQNNTTKAKLLAAKAAKRKQTEASKIKALLDNEDSDDDDVASITSNFDDELWSQICGRRAKIKNPKPTVIETVISDEIVENPSPEVGTSSLKLDNTAFKQLVGGSKRRALPSDVTITDIDESHILEKTEVWMRKALTDPQYQQKHTNDGESDTGNPVAKNKHHITFLAQQAKAKEQELQAQWASGNQKRQMSRAKYGF